MVSLVFGILAFLATTMIVAGLFGRPDERYPRCSACNADARPYAWDDPPRCACNADLSRPGSVRTRGRVRRLRLVVVGVALLVLTAALGIPADRAIATRGTLLAIIPEAILAVGIQRDWAWALREVNARAQSGQLEPTSAATLWRDVDRRLAAQPTASDDLLATEARLREVWKRDAAAGAAVIVEALAPRVTLRQDLERDALPTVRRGDTVLLAFQFVANIGDGAFVRIDSVRLGESRLSPALAHVFGRATRLVLDASDLPLVIPPDAPLGETVLSLELIAAQSPVARMAVGDALIDSDAAPSSWGIGAVAAPFRVEIPLRIEDARPAEGTP